MIPVIDLFAGPGGLSEGFSSIQKNGERLFHVRLAIESQEQPYRTLKVRSFFRQFPSRQVPKDYYRLLRGEISDEEMFFAWPAQASIAAEETWQTTLGRCDLDELHRRIAKVIQNGGNWVLIGGPPCQAYSNAGVVGNRTKKEYNPENDSRYGLYKEFIRVLASHNPSAFVLENVPGMLSAQLGGNRLIDGILLGLAKPSEFAHREFGWWPEGHRYNLLSLTSGVQGIGGDPSAYLIRSEEFGIPQTRHRVIIIGIRSDIDVSTFCSPKSKKLSRMDAVLNDLPPLRSSLSREPDSPELWRNIFNNLESELWIEEIERIHGIRFCRYVLKMAGSISRSSPTEAGAEFIKCKPSPSWQKRWYSDNRLGGVSHHETRPHIRSDLHRYLFCSCFAMKKGKSPKLMDFPPSLLPNHRNSMSGSFKDRFRVLLPDRPSGTIISHLAKDGHAFIHPDPLQCRSITPREAARLQTFPDNYYFFGWRTSIFHQIGNAVPPWLARIIGESLVELLDS